jgi:predicted SnoaL-like aldol condensation-catalyzing enzyme
MSSFGVLGHISSLVFNLKKTEPLQQCSQAVRSCLVFLVTHTYSTDPVEYTVTTLDIFVFVNHLKMAAKWG